MNASKASYIENQFGPPSELVDIAKFIHSTSAALSLPHFLHTATGRTRTRKRPPARDASNDSPQITKIQAELENVSLKAGMKNSDQNTLIQVKTTRTDSQAIITLTVHNKLSWRQSHVSRLSTHSVLSSQTLGDLFELTEEILDNGRVTGYQDAVLAPPGCVICIEGLAYGDGESEFDYAEAPVIIKAPTSMHDTPLSSLSLRIGEPYWLLHHGSCEHFIVVDQIRLQHPSDPPSGYPLTLQITPPCWTPCLLCAPCWDAMGDSNSDEVVVVPLPKYELGW
ncbi:hypothetical protein B0H10DRAFT_2001437 [Mycena sp. CBHHK59/15]|nr:hypothetical protein B0H10DRAFT_2001437 [Mycena sp. CBHHK59/15]